MTVWEPRSRAKHVETGVADSPDVLLIKKRAFVRLARPSMLSVPRKEVLMVLTALY